jgi:hypothetical protein
MQTSVLAITDFELADSFNLIQPVYYTCVCLTFTSVNKEKILKSEFECLFFNLKV